MINFKNFYSENNTIVRNQFEGVDHKGAHVFKSYSSFICKISGRKTYITSLWCYSRTTSKYTYQFLRKHGYNIGGRADVEELIRKGRIKLVSEWDLLSA